MLCFFLAISISSILKNWGRFRLLITFKKLAWIVYLDCMRDKKGRKYEWKAEEQIFPLSKPWINYFDSKSYKEKAKESQEQLSFEIDWECYKNKINEKGWKYKDLSQ
jgi:hypothetical protein